MNDLTKKDISKIIQNPKAVEVKACYFSKNMSEESLTSKKIMSTISNNG